VLDGGARGWRTQVYNGNSAFKMKSRKPDMSGRRRFQKRLLAPRHSTAASSKRVLKSSSRQVAYCGHDFLKVENLRRGGQQKKATKKATTNPSSTPVKGPLPVWKCGRKKSSGVEVVRCWQ
jgi:hypothetical protein